MHDEQRSKSGSRLPLSSIYISYLSSYGGLFHAGQIARVECNQILEMSKITERLTNTFCPSVLVVLHVRYITDAT